MAKRKRKSARQEEPGKRSNREHAAEPREAEKEPEGEEEVPAERVPGAAEETTSLVTVIHARNIREAKTMKSILESAEIPAFIGQEDAEPAEAGGKAVEAINGIPLLVPEELAGEAAEILAEAAMREGKGEDEEDADEDEWEAEEDEEDEEVLDGEAFKELEDDDEEHEEDLDQEGEGDF
jgi:hypothetical protein